MAVSDRAAQPRAARLRAPLLVALGALLAFETIGGLIIFWARLLEGATPGEALHIAAGIALTALYAGYQWRHWRRVRPFQPRLDYSLGLIAAASMALVNLTGLWLAWFWWQDRVASPGTAPVVYPALLSAAHNITSMLVVTFVGAHLGAVLMRERRA